MNTELVVLRNKLRNPALSTVISILLALFLPACSTLNIDSATKLASAGQNAATSNIENIFVSDEEYQRAMDAEAFFHGFAGESVPTELSKNYDAIQSEFFARKAVFVKLNNVYDEFSKLATLDAATGIESAVNDLGDAINGYASAQKKNAVVTTRAEGAITEITGIAVKEIQKEKLRESSVLIRERLSALQKLLSDPLVKSQMTSFKMNLAQNRASAIQLLWQKGVYDPTPLINEMGTESGLKASKDVLKIVFNEKDTTIKNGLEGVIVNRIDRKISLIEKGYNGSVKSIDQLISKHEKLEKGEELNLSMLRQIVAELQSFTTVLAPPSAASSK